jgi:hypothetical protein
MSYNELYIINELSNIRNRIDILLNQLNRSYDNVLETPSGVTIEIPEDLIVEPIIEAPILKKCKYTSCIGCVFGNFDECEYINIEEDLSKKCNNCNNSHYINYDYKQCAHCDKIYCNDCISYYFLCSASCVV